MKCPRCDSQKTRVVDSREGVDGRSVRRRRECESCEFRFTTFERIEESLPMVVKKGGQRESFDRYKILSGMKRACEKRPVSVLDLEDAVRGIEAQLLESGEKEISSGIIGELVISVLRELDQVAYVRFASVYREFSDISEFVETLRQLASTGVTSTGVTSAGVTSAGVTSAGVTSTGGQPCGVATGVTSALTKADAVSVDLTAPHLSKTKVVSLTTARTSPRGPVTRGTSRRKQEELRFDDLEE